MANNYTRFSEGIDGITPEERAWIESQLDADSWDPDAPLEWNAPLDDGLVGFEWELQETSPNGQLTEGESYLWLYDEESGDLDQVGNFVQAFLAKFRPGQCFTMTFSNSCSSPRLGEFSGGGVFVTKEGYEVFYAYDWLAGCLDQFRRAAVPQAADQPDGISTTFTCALPEGESAGRERPEIHQTSKTKVEGAVGVGTTGPGEIATPDERSSRRRFFRTVYSIVVLSEDEPLLTEDLNVIAYCIDERPCVGSVDVESSEEVSREAMNRLLLEVGNDGTFFDDLEDGDDEAT